ncbi:hypothetical protein [Kribbella sp. NPDC004536]|uniref:hypothetical protein n=1 Tax=Kribbella sp. NPDC004536 TaxID=3364106 RepID=UPI0036968514
MPGSKVYGVAWVRALIVLKQIRRPTTLERRTVGVGIRLDTATWPSNENCVVPGAVVRLAHSVTHTIALARLKRRPA